MPKLVSEKEFFGSQSKTVQTSSSLLVWLCPRTDILHSLWSDGLLMSQEIAYEYYFLKNNTFGKYWIAVEFKVIQLNTASFPCSLWEYLQARSLVFSLKGAEGKETKALTFSWPWLEFAKLALCVLNEFGPTCILFVHTKFETVT